MLFDVGGVRNAYPGDEWGTRYGPAEGELGGALASVRGSQEYRVAQNKRELLVEVLASAVRPPSLRVFSQFRTRRANRR